jgi:hypothetical protein
MSPTSISGGHISPSSLKRSGRFFTKEQKILKSKSCYKQIGGKLNETLYRLY